MPYDENLRGALFKNDKKSQENQPDYTGKINIDGKDYWLSAWLKTAESGRKYMSLSATPKEAQEAQQERRPPPKSPSRPGSAASYGSAGSGSRGDDDSIPF